MKEFYYNIPVEVRVVALVIIAFSIWYIWLKPINDTPKKLDKLNETMDELNRKYSPEFEAKIDSILDMSKDFLKDSEKEQENTNEEIKDNVSTRTKILYRDINNISTYTDAERDSTWARESRQREFVISPGP